MKALTIRQPWATFIVTGLKSYETRSWQTKYRGPLAIHAAKRPMDLVILDLLMEQYGYKLRREEALYSIGAIIAIVELVEITPVEQILVTHLEGILGDYTPGRFAWHLALKERLKEPIPAQGKQGLWDWKV